MSTADTKLAIAKIASSVQTIGQARAALGATTRVLSEGYAKLDELTSVADVRDTARSLLDSNNAYAARIYSTWNDDPDLQDQEISVLKCTQVATCLEQARSNVRLIEDIASQDLWSFASILSEAIAAAVGLGKDVGNGLTQLIKVPLAFGAGMLQGLWPVLLLAGFGVVIFFWARKRALKALV